MIATASSASDRETVHRLVLEGRCLRAVVSRAEAAEGSASALARRAAERLAATLPGLVGRSLRVASLPPSGRPVLLVDGRAGREAVSLAHADGLVAAVVCPDAAVGIDLVDPAEAGRGLDFWFTPDELGLEPDEGLLRARLWAAKEAGYKAAALDVPLAASTVTIQALAPREFRFVARSPGRLVAGTGRFLAAGRHVVAIAVSLPSLESSPR